MYRDNTNLKFLIAEDDIDDQLLLRDAFDDNNIHENCFEFVNNGQELLHYLSKQNDFQGIIFLDINMPIKSGREVLVDIKNSPTLKHIPILMFSTSSLVEDIRTCYTNGANTYLVKPKSYNDLITLIATIKDYWFDLNTVKRV